MVYYWVQAIKHLSPQGEDRLLVVWMQGIGAARENFTEEGWRLKQRSAVCLLIPFAFMFMYVWFTVVMDLVRRPAT